MTSESVLSESVCPPQVAEEMAAEARRLLEFARKSVIRGGFGWLGDDGELIDRDVELWITCRMTHVCALGHLLGEPGFAELTEHGVAALQGRFHDDDYGGWFAKISAGERRPTSAAKEAYGHAFVILAGSSAQVVEARGSDDLLSTALAVFDRHFWDESDGMARESFTRDWAREEPYRGINANMHTVEAFLAAGDVTGDPHWHERAGRIVTRAIDGFARGNAWRLPEHFDTQWQPLPDYNADEPAHPFRPYGATVGHALEWARLTLATAATLRDAQPGRWDWATDAAVRLTERAVADGWARDDTEGFVYTTDWDGEPVVSARMHWVLTEALGAAWALHRATGDPRWATSFQQWWAYAKANLLDLERGSWHHELDATGATAAGTWSGKPDVYHAVQAMLLPRLPLIPSFASALARN